MIVCLRTVAVPPDVRERYLQWIEQGRAVREAHGLLAEWTAIEKDGKKGKAPRGLYEEPELTVRVVRDLFTGGEFKEMITDSRELYES